jgi:hypothetical protein
MYIAIYNHGICTDFNSTRYFRYFNNFTSAQRWLNDHKQQWNTGHRVLAV